jgi:outer membrane receptor for ferrienterochelin and colicins
MRIIIKAWLLIFLFLFTFPAVGQNQMVKVLDKHTGEPVPFAYVCIESLDKKLRSNNLTDINGTVNITFNSLVQVAVSSVGYTSLIDTIKPGKSFTFYLEQAPTGLSEVVVTGQLTPQRVDKSIYKVDVISGLQIEEKAAQNLQELLTTELNIRSTQDNVLGSGLSIQGLTGENVKILIDGVPVIGRQNGIIDMSQIDLSNVDHVEIVEGPMSVIYGSNALAGAVNIITKDNSRSKLRGQLNTYYETVGVYNGDAAFSVRKNKNLFSFSGGRNFFGGFSVDTSKRSLLWKPKEQYNATAAYQFSGANLKMNLQGSLFNEQLRNPGDLSPDFNYEKAFDEYYFTRRYDAKSSGTWKRSGSGGTFSFLAAYSYYEKIKRTYLKNLVDLSKVLAADPAKHDTATIDAIVLRGYYSNAPGTKINYQLGYDLNLEMGTGKRMNGDKAIYDYAAFFSLRYDPLKSLSLQPGLRAIYNTKYKAPLVWSLSSKWDPVRNLQLRVSTGQGFRSPSLKELYLDFRDSNHNVLGNEDLKAEKSFNLNGSATYLVEYEKSSFIFETKVYFNRIKNKIDLLYDPVDPTGAMYMNIPGNNFVTKGLSFNARYRLHPRFSMNAGISLDGKSRLDDLSSFSWTKNLASGFNYKNLKYKFNLSLYYKYTGSYRDYRGEFDLNNQIGSITEVYMSGYNIMDITLSRPFFNNRVNIGTGVKNLFDVTNVSSYGGGSSVHGSDGSTESSVGWGRTFFLKVSYMFNKY